MATTKREATRFCQGNKTKILKCVGEKKESEFFQSWSDFSPDGYTPICKDCANKAFNYYISKGCSGMSALWYTLMRLDIPFIKEVYEQVNHNATVGDKNGRKTPLSIGVYINTLQKRTLMKDALKDFSYTDVDMSEVESKLKTREIKQKEIDDYILRWGNQEEVSDYVFLDSVFEELTSDIEIENKGHEMLFRDLCLLRLRKRKLEGNSNSETTELGKVQAQILGLMKTLKLDDFSSSKAKTTSELSLFEKIRLCDSNNVQDVYKEPTIKYDLNKIQEYNEKFSYRPLLNMLVGHRDFDISMEDIEQYDLD